MDAQRIRIRLIEKGLLVKDLARLTGLDYDRLAKLLNGYRAARDEEIRAIAKALGLPVDEISA